MCLYCADCVPVLRRLCAALLRLCACTRQPPGGLVARLVSARIRYHYENDTPTCGYCRGHEARSGRGCCCPPSLTRSSLRRYHPPSCLGGWPIFGNMPYKTLDTISYYIGLLRTVCALISSACWAIVVVTFRLLDSGPGERP